MKLRFYKTGELDGSSYVKNPLRSNALINNKNKDKYCFIWSISDSFHLYIVPPNRVSNYKPHFNELNINGFDFTNGFKCNDFHKFETLKNFSVNIVELNFYQDQNKWRHKLTPIEISKKSQIELLI